MACNWAPITALVLLVLTAERAARPSSSGRDLVEGAPNLSNEYILSTCPHIIRRITSPQQILGAWYLWQLIGHGNDLDVDSCIRYTYGSEGDRLTLRLDRIYAGVVNRSMEFAFTQNPNDTLWDGVGERVMAGFQMGYPSNNDNVLVLCMSSVVRRPFVPDIEDIELSYVFGREPTLDEAAITAAVNATALAAARAIREVVTVRPPLQECTAPAASAP